ncbi:MAG TPA: mersacidin/lichenicidin family type 2 lantibiotic [Herpetosiphonaceae bacterium]
MSNVEIIRAWKDEEFRSSLSAAQLAMLPAHPAGMIEVSDAVFGNAGDCDTWDEMACSSVCIVASCQHAAC